MTEKSLKGKIIKEYVKYSISGIPIPTFVVKLSSGETEEFGRGVISVESFPKKVMSMNASDFEKFTKQPFYGLKVGNTIYISRQENWD